LINSLNLDNCVLLMFLHASCNGVLTRFVMGVESGGGKFYLAVAVAATCTGKA